MTMVVIWKKINMHSATLQPSSLLSSCGAEHLRMHIIVR